MCIMKRLYEDFSMNEPTYMYKCFSFISLLSWLVPFDCRCTWLCYIFWAYIYICSYIHISKYMYVQRNENWVTVLNFPRQFYSTRIERKRNSCSRRYSCHQSKYTMVFTYISFLFRLCTVHNVWAWEYVWYWVFNLRTQMSFCLSRKLSVSVPRAIRLVSLSPPFYISGCTYYLSENIGLRGTKYIKHTT